LIIALFANSAAKSPFLAPREIKNVADAFRYCDAELQASFRTRVGFKYPNDSRNCDDGSLSDFLSTGIATSFGIVLVSK
jgi:hypothetical protein